MVLDLGDECIVHSVGRAQLEFLTCLVEHIDRAGLGAGKLRRLADDRGRARFARSSVELTAWVTSPSARNSSTDCVSSRVRACTSSNSRTFSIAITAWSAKVVDQLDLLVGERPHCERHKMMTPMGVPSRMSGTPSTGSEADDLLGLGERVLRDRRGHREYEPSGPQAALAQ